jgi:hypothetical protein
LLSKALLVGFGRTYSDPFLSEEDTTQSTTHPTLQRL